MKTFIECLVATLVSCLNPLAGISMLAALAGDDEE